MSKSQHHHHHKTEADFTQILQPEAYTQISQQPVIRTRKPFILKSLTIILLLTIVVLAINYYLISNCPSSETASSQEPSSEVLRHHEQKQPHQQQENSIDVTPVKRHVVTVSVYYEVLCPDSKSFILHQVVPVQKKYGELINIRYIPFGKARYSKSGDSGEWQFSCQHGPEECHGNKLHACLVESYSRDQSMLTSMVACSMDKYNLWGATINSITSVTSECRQKYAPNDSLQPVLCNNASSLLKKYGEETLGLHPPVSFIPTISIDGSLSNQRQILRDLSTVVCKHLKQTNNNNIDC